MHSESDFFSTELFDEWAFNYFFPEKLKKMKINDCESKILLILDGFGAHDSNYFLSAYTENGILLFLALHTSEQTQEFNIGIFWFQKSKM